jgi:hypothetical protein
MTWLGLGLGVALGYLLWRRIAVGKPDAFVVDALRKLGV